MITVQTEGQFAKLALNQPAIFNIFAPTNLLDPLDGPKKYLNRGELFPKIKLANLWIR